MKLKDLKVSECNVRQQVDEDLSGLSRSIKSTSLISKIILRPSKKGMYEIIAGSRRYRALLGLYGEDHELSEDQYIVMEDLDDERALIISIQENQQRKDLSPMELNRTALKLNKIGYKDKKIAQMLNITPYRLKRIYQISADFNKMPEEVVNELKKPSDEAKINDAHWDKIRKSENEDVIKDTVDYILDKECPPREVPSILKNFEKQYAGGSGGSAGADDGGSEAPPDDGGPIVYEHKGQLVLEKHGDKSILKVIGKGEDEEIPLDHYIKYLEYPEKFKCMVSFKLKVKPIS